MTSRSRLLVLLLAFLAAIASSLSAATISVAHAEGTYTIGGIIDGSDGRAVNALIGLDLQDAQGQVLSKTGCVRSPECPVSSYGVVVNVNPTLPAEGTADTSTAGIQLEWTAEVPENTANVYIEVYPKNNDSRRTTTETRYGHAMRHNITIPTTDQVDLHLPLICAAGGSTGSVSGTAVKNGAPIGLTRAIAWSIDRYDAVQRPTLGWNIGTARSDGTYEIPNLASGQRYQVWTTTSEGERHKEIGVVINACENTTSNVDFTPPPPPAEEPAPSAPPPPPPTLEIGSSLIRAGMSARMSGAADPGQTVELLAYSRPSTTYNVVRTTTASDSGAYTFVVSPQTNTRLKVRINGQESETVVVSVQSVVTLRYVKDAARTYTFTGRVLPRRQGQLVSVYAQTPSGDRLVGRGQVDAQGIWKAAHRFTVPGSFPIYATTGRDIVNDAGRSTAVKLTIA